MKQPTDKFTLVDLLSLLTTPWLIIVSTASALYLKNQTDLHYHYDLLYPYLGAALLIFCIGVVITLLVKNSERFTPLLWLYYLLAPFYLVFRFSAGHITNNIALLIWTALLGVGLLTFIALLTKKANLRQTTPLFALIGCAFVTVDSFNFFTGYETYKPSHSLENSANQAKSNEKTRPNIYHLIFDEYQVDMFSLTLNEKVRKSLSGFTLFEDATAVFGRTEMSLSSIFSGKEYDFASAPIEYQKAAFTAESSLLSILKNYGYQTSAIMHPVYDFELENFDNVGFHKQVRQLDYGSISSAFRKLWIFSVLPAPISGQFLDPVDLDQLQHKNLLPVSAPIKSYESMLNLIAEEEYFAGSNRYQLIHLLIPHFPNVLTADCSFTPDQKTSPIEQSHCATKLIIDFINRLKALGRFDDSMIIVQSDHGARFKTVNGKLRGLGESDAVRFGTAWSRARSRSVLLIKPAEVSATDIEFQVSNGKASLLDVTPTIIGTLGLESNQLFDGSNVFDPDFTKLERQRFYYFYNKKDAKGKHLVKMTRFRVEDTELIDEGLVGSGEFK